MQSSGNASNISKSEAFPLKSQESTDIVKQKRTSSVKADRRLSFHQSVTQLSSSGSKTRVNLNRPQSLFLEVPTADGDISGDLVDRFESQRTSFDLPALRQIIWIVSCSGFVAGLAAVIIQIIVQSHKSYKYLWGIGFWSGTASTGHAVVGCLTLWRSLELHVRCKLARAYFALSAAWGIISVAEMSCSILVYHRAADIINSTSYDDDRPYPKKVMEISAFNSLLSSFGLVGLLGAIFASVVTLQRLNIDLKIAQSFTTLISRRPSAVPEKPERITNDKNEEAVEV